MNRACYPKEKRQNSQKKDGIHELFVLVLSLVWFAGATPDSFFRGFLVLWLTRLSQNMVQRLAKSGRKVC